MHIVKHNLLKGLKEILLEIKGSELFSLEEFISKLPKTVDCKNSHHQIGMGTNPNEMLTKHFPNFAPDKTDTDHIHISDLN